MAVNNETTTKFKVDISELKAAMQEARKQVAYANSEFKAVSSSMDDWSKSSEGINAKLKQLESNLKSQERILNEYEKTLEEVKREYGENSREALEYATKLNNQKAVVNKIKREMSDYEDALQQVSNAERIAARTGQDVAEVLNDVGEEAEEAEGGFTVLKGAVAEFVGNGLTALVGGLRDAIASLATLGDEADKAMNSFQASTGATAEEMAEFEGVMKDIYNANFGESFDDIAAAMSEIKKQAGDIGADELEKMTTNALILRDTFDFEVNESMRATKMLMTQFGLSGEEAYNLIAQGAQNGLNKNGDLLDTINEYAVHYKGLGYTSEQFFNSLANGTAAGTFSVDKLGDAMKEFGIRVRDGSDTTAEAFEILGYDAEEMFKQIEDGSFFAEGMVGALIDELGGMPDSIEKTTAGVGLFGTMWEDLGAEGIRALGNLNGEIALTEDALEQINAVKYDSVGEALQGIGRNLQTGILMPISEKILPIVSEMAVKFQEWLNDPATQEGIKNLTDSVAEFAENGLVVVKDFVMWLLANKDAVIGALAGIAAGFVAFKVATLIMSVTSAIKGFTSGLTLAQVAMKAFNLVIASNPIGAIATAIALVVGALVSFIVANEDVRNKIVEIWNIITQAIGTFVENAIEFFKELPTKISEWISTTIENVTQWKDDMIEKAKETGSKFLENIVTFFSELPYNVGYFIGLVIGNIIQWAADMIAKAKETGSNFVDGIIEFFRTLPGKIHEWITNVIAKVTKWKNDMIEKAKETGRKFIDEVVTKIKELPGKVNEWLASTIEKIKTWVSDMGQKGKEAIGELIENVTEGAKEIPDKMLSIGSDIVDGVWNGIKNAKDQFFTNVKGFFSGLVDGAKEALDINSPSKVFAKEVGKWIPEGIAVGITDNAKSVLGAMKDLTVNALGSAKAGLNTPVATTAGGSAVGGVVNNFYQTINSPKQLNRLEIYRQSKNLLGYAGGGL